MDSGVLESVTERAAGDTAKFLARDKGLVDFHSYHDLAPPLILLQRVQPLLIQSAHNSLSHINKTHNGTI